MDPRELAPGLILIKQGTHNFTHLNSDGIRNIYHQVTSSVILYFGVQTVVIDSGARFYRDDMKTRLEKYVNLNDVHIFIATHYHHDHIDNSDLFPNADRILDYGRVTPGGVMTSFQNAESIARPDDIEIFGTPGHVKNHISVKITIDGIRYVCAGDAVREDVLNRTFQPEYVDEQYIASARKVFENADIIIPGHGEPFESNSKNLPPLLAI